MTDRPDDVPPPASRREAAARARSEFETHVAHARDQFEEANERIKQRTGRDLIGAILIALVIGAIVLSSLIFFKWLFVVFAAVAVALATHELCRALAGGGRRVDMIPQIIVGLALVVSSYFVDLWLLWVLLFAAVVVVVVWRMIAQMAAQDGRRYGDVVSDILVAGFIQLYIPFLASLALILLRHDNGEWWVLAFLIVSVAADTGAYAAGISFGKHPMAPRISPKKTWEGFGGAVVFALGAGVLLALFMLHLPWWAGLVFGAVILLTATVGDLGESMIKRDLGVKDMSNWLPGHGGFFDRLDSMLPSGAMAFALYFFATPLMAN